MSAECRYCGETFDTEFSVSVHVGYKHEVPWKDEEKIRELYHDQLMSVPDIAEKYGVSSTPIRRKIRESDIETRTSGESINVKTHKLIDDDYVLGEYFKHNKSTVEIANEYPDRVCPRNIKQVIERAGRELRDGVERMLADRSVGKLQNAEWLQEKYENEKSCIPIANELGVSKGAVQNALERHDIQAKNDSNYNPNWKGGHSRYMGPNWNEQRQRRIERDGGKCVVCKLGMEEHKSRYNRELNVHHIEPRRKYIENGELDYKAANRIENLITLCQSCHKKWEKVPLRPQI